MSGGSVVGVSGDQAGAACRKRDRLSTTDLLREPPRPEPQGGGLDEVSSGPVRGSSALSMWKAGQALIRAVDEGPARCRHNPA